MTAPADLRSLSNHVVVLNVNASVRSLVEQLAFGADGREQDVVLLVQDRRLWDEHPEWQPESRAGVRVIEVDGCPTEPRDLAAVGVARARAAVILADPRQGRLADASSTLVAVAVERQSPQVHTVMELQESVNRVHVRATEVNEVVCLGELAEQLIAQCCISPGIARVFAELLHAAPETTQIFLLNLPEHLTGRSYRELAERLARSNAPCIPCGFVRVEGDEETVILNPKGGVLLGRDTALSALDRLVVIAYRRLQLEDLLTEP